MRRLVVIVVALGLAAAACSSDVNAQAVIASNPGSIGVGEQRVLIAVVDVETRQSLASPDIGVTATLRDRIGTPLGEHQGEFIWIVPEVRGLYKFDMDIPGPGTSQVTLEAGDLGELGPVGLVTVEDPLRVEVGEPAPRSDSRTADDHDLEDITTDPDPDPSFYEMSVAEAVESGPSVIVFATPAWCTTESCGPMLDQVKELSGDFPNLNYVHVEIYENINATSSEDLVLVPAVVDWQLPSEPWVFVTDDEGVVTAAFEGAASDSELASAFAAVSP